jgi:endonuclease YncB( thermonuclease family)
MKIRPLLIPIGVISAFSGAVAWLVLADPPTIPDVSNDGTPEPKASAGAPDSPETDLQIAAAQPSGRQPAAPIPEDIRNVSPEGVSAPEVTGNLKRIAPSERFLELMNPPVEPIPDGPLELIRVEVPDGGHLKSDRLVVTLAHIDPLPLDATCETELGASWPCGTRARTFLRGLVRRLKVTCSKEHELGPQSILAECQRGNIDLSTQLVRFGWANVTEDAPDNLRELAELAKSGKIGQWQSEWDTGLPENNWTGQTQLDQIGLEELAPDVIDWSLRTNEGDTFWSGSGNNQELQDKALNDE